MEHLPLPVSSSNSLPRVPYICKESPYDEGDFLTYPERAGWPCVLQNGDQLSWVTAENLQPSEDKALESFLQSWLFFGLLHHVLAPVELYSPDDYLMASGYSLYVHTASLENKLSSWLDLVRYSQPDTKVQVLDDLTQCLKLAHLAYRVTLLPSHRGFDKAIRLGLGAVYEAIEAAVDMACDGKCDILSVAPEIDESTRNSMISYGWCPAEISAAANDFCSLSGRIYLQHMRKPDVGIVHTACTPETCKQTQINLETYQPRHVTKDCHCESLGPKMDDIIACLQEKIFPLLKIDSTGELEIHPYRPGMSYVALSHVWADGLGNPHDMALPRCQILKLRSLLTGIRQMRSRTGDEVEASGSEDLYLWCDTLCCPTSQPGKAAAMGKLRAVYQNSSCVLLLESTLADYYRYSEMDRLEAMMRVLTSKWIRRLWTYQEAGLTRKLLVQFNDGPVDMKDIWDSVRLELTNRISGRYLYRNAAFGGSVLRTLFNQAPNLTNRIEEIEFAMAVRGLSYRRVSVQTDEALCIAAVFDLDMEAVLREEPERRMEIVWSLMLGSKRGIPETMIFNEQPRLTSIGYRWAPATLQQSVTRFQTLPPRGDRVARASTLCHGLPVSRPGYRIRLAGPPSCLSSDFSPPIEPEHLLCRLRDPDGRWLNMFMDRCLIVGEQPSLLSLLQDGQKDWHLILEDSLGRHGFASQQRALLTYLIHHDSGQEVFRSTAIVQVAYEEQGWDTFRQGIYPSAARLRYMWPIQLLTVGSRCEMVLSTILSWFPALLRRPAVAMMNRVFSVLGTAIARWTAARIEKQAELTSKMPRLAAWMKHMNSKRGTAATDVEDVKAFILPIFMGRVATVVQEFGSEHVWHVD